MTYFPMPEDQANWGVGDSLPLEDHLLPEPVETFLFMALCWCLVVWLLACSCHQRW